MATDVKSLINSYKAQIATLQSEYDDINTVEDEIGNIIASFGELYSTNYNTFQYIFDTVSWTGAESSYFNSATLDIYNGSAGLLISDLACLREDLISLENTKLGKIDDLYDLIDDLEDD